MKQSEKPAAAQAIIAEMRALGDDVKAKGLRFGSLTRQLAKVAVPPAETSESRKAIRIVETYYGVERRKTPDAEFTFFVGPVPKGEANDLVKSMNEVRPDSARLVTRGLTDWSA